jgi:hypothetical protein
VRKLRTRGSGVRISPGALSNQIIARRSVQRRSICYENATTCGDDYVGHFLARFIHLVQQGVCVHVECKGR